VTVRCTDPAAYNRAVAAELDEAFRRVATGGTYVLGPELEAFETEFASYVGAPHCVGVGSGFDALVLGLRALGIGPGDEVLVPAHTFVATWLAVAAVGAVPVGVDVDDRTLLLDRTLLDAAVTPRTRAVVPVHLHGHPAAMAELTAWAARHGVLVLADAAQAHGARLDGRDIGAFGDASAWSFYPTKNLGCLGDGGAVTTSDPDVARQLRRIRDYGFERPGRSSTGGVNSRLDELQAALLRVKLRSLESCNDARRSQASRYLDGLGDLDALRLPMSPPDVVSVWHHFVIRCAPGVRERLRTDLADAGVETLVHYPEPPFAQPAFAALAIDPAVFPVTCRVVDEVVSLPIGLHLSDTDQTRVVEALHGALRAG
jgi:dTDP-3-amino-3,4,6-trideoxy-alpha-D-glucose transaminase